MSEAKRIKYVSFRLTDEEYTEIEKAAVAAGDDPNNWCRNLALRRLVKARSLARRDV